MSWVLKYFGGGCDDDEDSDDCPPLRMVIVKSRALVRKLLSDCGGDDGVDGCNHNSSGSSSSSSSSSVRLDVPTGSISNGRAWFASTCQRLVEKQKQKQKQREKEGGKNVSIIRFKHPLKAPMVLSPVDEKTPICRYHNYHRDGCRLYKKNSNSTTQGEAGAAADAICPFDHDHCHACQQLGHVAKNCLQHETQTCY